MPITLDIKEDPDYLVETVTGVVTIDDFKNLVSDLENLGLLHMKVLTDLRAANMGKISRHDIREIYDCVTSALSRTDCHMRNAILAQPGGLEYGFSRMYDQVMLSHIDVHYEVKTFDDEDKALKWLLYSR